MLQREAARLGFAEHDPIIRRRLGQKMRFALEDANEAGEPAEEQLLAYLEAHSENYLRPATISFVQVFLAGTAQDDEGFASIGQQLREGADPARLGDAFVHGREFLVRDEREIAASFGSAFARELFASESKGWVAITSAYGEHWVRVSAREAARPATLDEVRPSVRGAWKKKARQDKLAEELERLRVGYEIRLPSAGEIEKALDAEGSR
jgi:hypothetical protein